MCKLKVFDTDIIRWFEAKGAKMPPRTLAEWKTKDDYKKVIYDLLVETVGEDKKRIYFDNK